MCPEPTKKVVLGETPIWVLSGDSHPLGGGAMAEKLQLPPEKEPQEEEQEVGLYTGGN